MQRRVSESAGWGLVVLLALVAGGCASVSGHLPEVPPEVSAVLVGEPGLLVDTGAEEASAFFTAVAERDAAGRSSSQEPPKDQVSDPAQPASPEGAQARDEDYDPFAKKEEELSGKIEEYDPWEGYNAAVFEFNRKLDRYAIKPIAKVYNRLLPDAVQRGISNLFHHARFVPRFFNNLFQGKLKGAGV
ncbi:MAG: MlaA family lipoprotein, partial [Nitrospiraceae bacterium]